MGSHFELDIISINRTLRGRRGVREKGENEKGKEKGEKKGSKPKGGITRVNIGNVVGLFVIYERK